MSTAPRLATVVFALGLVACDGAAESKPPPSAAAASDSEPADDATLTATSKSASASAATAAAGPPGAGKTAAMWAPPPGDPKSAEHPLVHPERLAHFYDALARLDDGKKEVVQVVHLGASMIGADDLTSVLRGKFQTRFGDGGAGLVLLQRYMTNYLHNWVKLTAKKWSNCYIGYLCDKTGYYGLGGAEFYGKRGAETTIKTRKQELGDEAAHFEVWYAKEPGGAKLEVRIDGGAPTEVDTAGDTLTNAFYETDVTEGPHEINVRVVGNGRVRGYGVVLETEGPGITWDQFSMLGAFTKRINAWDDEHIAGQVRQRDPELVAFMYGGNDSRRVANGKVTKEGYVEEYLTGVKKVMAGKPDASCLIVGLVDRSRSLEFHIEPEHVALLSEAQRDVADQAGCAFFDTVNAMGGGGALARWRKMDPPLAAPDRKHLNHAGREVLGGWIYDAIMVGYAAHRGGR